MVSTRVIVTRHHGRVISARATSLYGKMPSEGKSVSRPGRPVTSDVRETTAKNCDCKNVSFACGESWRAILS